MQDCAHGNTLPLSGPAQLREAVLLAVYHFRTLCRSICTEWKECVSQKGNNLGHVWVTPGESTQPHKGSLQQLKPQPSAL